MGVAVYADLTLDRNRIALIAAGEIAEVTHLAKQLQQLTPLIKPSEPKGGLVMPLSWPALVQLSAVYGDRFVPLPRLAEWAQAEAGNRVQPLDQTLGFAVPDGLTPRPYQVAGALEIARTGRALIMDEPGTGKTITAILGLAELHRTATERTHPLPILVICPASVVDPWVEAFGRWAPWWTAVAWRGTPKQRRAKLGHADVYVTSYDTARMDAKDTHPERSPLVGLDPRALVVDECHLIKNHHAARTAAVRRLARNVRAFIALSGTPITHHPADLWPTLTCLAPGAWPSRERWVSRYCLTANDDYSENILGLNPGTEPEFRLAVHGQSRRVAKADVLDQLPPKIYSVRTVTLPREYRKAYDDMEQKMLTQLPDGSELSVMSVLAKMTRLSQLASAAADVTTTFETKGGEEVEKVTVTLKAPSWKVDALIEVLDERPGKPVVAFAPSAQLMRLAGATAAAAGKRVGYVIGGQNPTERTATVEAFQNGELDLICVTTGAGGVGITLTAASTVVFLQRPWSLVESLQAEDRCHRIGSEIHDSIEIIDIVADDTLDTRVRAVLRERAGQLADLVQDHRIVAELLGGTHTRQLRKAS